MSPHHADQHRLDQLQADVDLIIDSDAAFFTRHKDRRHRLRIAGRAEVEMLRAVHGEAEVRLPFYCLIRCFAPGSQVRHYVPNRAGIDTDISEACAAALFDHLAPAGSQAAEISTVVDVLSKNAEGRR